MPTSRAIDDEQRAEIVRLYREGRKVDDIAADYRISRPSIYFILQAAGIAPNRQRRGATPGVTIDQLLERLRLAEQEIGRLTALLEIREAELNALTGQLDGAAPASH